MVILENRDAKLWCMGGSIYLGLLICGFFLLLCSDVSLVFGQINAQCDFIRG